ncbi:MAG: hypothetical protein NC087_04505 [Anaeroplasma bactoclasticum]|nr:hypothetical protein [Anaeroplasma bactoclasticum]
MSNYDEALKGLSVNIDWDCSSESFKTLQNLVYKVETLENALGCGIDKMIEFADWMAKCIQIEQEIGCPIYVVFKALQYGIVIINEKGYYNTAYSKEEFDNKFKQSKYDFPKLYVDYDGLILSELDSPYGDTECGYYGCRVKVSDYKKTWWLKEDRSE